MGRIGHGVSVALVCLVTAAPSRLPPDGGPGAVVGHRLAYDGVGRRMLLYAGMSFTGSGREYRSTLWSLAGDRWTLVDSGGPPGRDDPQVGFDTKRGTLLVHGGRRFGTSRDDVTLLTDTWLRDGRGWRLADSAGPPRRMHPGMAYDEKRGVMVLFGGFGADDSLRADTWEWDGDRWRRAADGPPRRWVNGLGYDRRLGAVVLHSVAFDSVDRDTGIGRSELWRWDGSSWRSIGAGPPISPQFPVVGTDEGLLIFDGWGRRDGQRVANTWRWDGASWIMVPAPGPPPRRGTAMGYDYHRLRTVLVGGETDDTRLSDRWEFDGVAWRRLP